MIDLLDFPLPLLDKMYKEYTPENAPEVLQRMARLIVPADAYIVVSGEYNHMVPPALSNLLNHFLEEYFWKPSAIARRNRRLPVRNSDVRFATTERQSGSRKTPESDLGNH